MTSTSYDIITIGGGIGGSTLAKAMAEQGARVLVLERETEFKDRVRGEAMPPWGTAEAKLLGIYQLWQDTCGQDIPWLEIYLGPDRIVRRDAVATTPQQTPFYSLYHPSMQEVLLQAAGEAGAEVRRGIRVTGFQPGNPPTVVVDQNGQTESIQARLVIGADGRSSGARKWGDFTVQRDPGQVLTSGVLFESMPIPEDTTRHFSNVDIGQMAFWFPQKEGHVRVYVCHQKETNYQLNGEEHVPRFIEEAVKSGAPADVFEGVKAIGPLATFDGANNWVQHPYKEGVALVGDAAACVDPAWGEGLSLTMRDVRVLRDQLLSQDDWDAAGHAYAEEHDRHFGALHTVCNWLTQFFFELGPKAEIRRARALPLIAQDGTRIPDLFALGPEVPVDETARRRFFGEE